MKAIENIYHKRYTYFNIYVIRGTDGDILIDTGFIWMRRALVRWLDKFNIKLIILTHAHVDHIWNAKYLQDRYKCKIAMCEDDIENIDNTKIKSTAVNKKHVVATAMMQWGMKHFKADDRFKIDIKLKDNDELNVFGLNLKIVSLKGHTNGLIGVLYKDYLFAGDALVNRRPKAELAYQNQDNDAAVESAKRIYKIHPKIIFIGHEFPVKWSKFEKSYERICNYNITVKNRK